MSHQCTLGASILALALLAAPLAHAAEQKAEATVQTAVVAPIESSAPIELPMAPARPSEGELVGGSSRSW